MSWTVLPWFGRLVDCRVVTVMPVSVGFTKKPRQPAQPRLMRNVKLVSSNNFRLAVNMIFRKPEGTHTCNGSLRYRRSADCSRR